MFIQSKLKKVDDIMKEQKSIQMQICVLIWWLVRVAKCTLCLYNLSAFVKALENNNVADI